MNGRLDARAREKAAAGVRQRAGRLTLALNVPAAKFPARSRNEASAFCSLSGSIEVPFLVESNTTSCRTRSQFYKILLKAALAIFCKLQKK
jgi:hypothetical protein